MTDETLVVGDDDKLIQDQPSSEELLTPEELDAIDQLAYPQLALSSDVQRYLVAHEEELESNKAYILKAFDEAIATIRAQIKAEKRNQELVRKSSDGLSDPIKEVVKEVRQALEVSSSRDQMLRWFRLGVERFKKAELQVYEGDPHLYTKLEKTLMLACESDKLPRDWTEEARNILVSKLKTQETFYFDQNSSKDNSIYRDLFKQFREAIINSKSSKNQAKQAILILIQGTKLIDPVVATLFQFILDEWSRNSFLAESFEERETKGYKKQKLVEIKKAHEERRTKLTAEFDNLKRQIQGPINGAAEEIVKYSKKLLKHDFIIQCVEDFQRFADDKFITGEISVAKNEMELRKHLNVEFQKLLDRVNSIDRSTLSTKEKGLLRQIYVIMFETYSKFDEQGLFPTREQYQKYSLKYQVSTAWMLHEEKSWIGIGSDQYQTYRELLSNIDNSKSPREMSYALVRAKLQADINHLNIAAVGRWKISPRKHSRWGKAIEKVRQENTSQYIEGKGWDSGLPDVSIDRDTFTRLAIQTRENYLNGHWWSHNRTRVKQINALILELYTIAENHWKMIDGINPVISPGMPDSDQTEKLTEFESRKNNIIKSMQKEQGRVWAKHMDIIQKDHASRNGLKKLLSFSKESTLFTLLAKAKTAMQIPKVMPTMDYHDHQLPIILKAIETGFQTFRKKYNYDSKDKNLNEIHTLADKISKHENVNDAQQDFQNALQSLESLLATPDPKMHKRYIDKVKHLQICVKTAYQELVSSKLFAREVPTPPRSASPGPITE